MTMIVTLTMSPAIDISTSTERVVPVGKLRCSVIHRDPGGGGLNVARVIQRFGGECRAIYPEGGCTGTLLRRLLDAEGIISLSVKSAVETRESLTVLEESSGSQYRFLLPGPELGRSQWQACLDLLASLPDPPTFIVASGSLPPGVPDDFYAGVARIAASMGARMVLDSSGPALASALGSGVYLVKPNLRELRGLAGRPLQQQQEWENAAADIVRTGKAEVVMLTLGKHGAFLASRRERVRAPGLAVEMVSAVGAGDCFLGAAVWRLSQGDSLENAFRYGVAAGTAALLTRGTGLCTVKDVERLFGQVRVER